MQTATILKARLPDVQEKSPARKFRTMLTGLGFIGFYDLVEAGIIADDKHGEVEFRYIKLNIWSWYIGLDDETAEKLWPFIEAYRTEAEASL